MSIRKYSFTPNEFYHVYNRGTDKRVIFQDTSDYQRFQSLLYLLNTEESINIRDVLKRKDGPYALEFDKQLVSIGAYCLMPNHFHLLLSPKTETSLSLFMQKIATSYSMYFNRRYERTGSLFEGKFKAEFVNEDRYLKYLYSYIHLNPVKLVQSDWREVGIKNLSQVTNYLNQYPYSSYVDVVGMKREESVILEPASFPVYFENVEKAQEEIQEWLSYSQT
jgi:putative transposase